MKRLAGKTALITGAARGIGLAFAKAYADYLATLEHLTLADVMRQTDAARPEILSA